METPVKIYTDGGCQGNPGPGGWAYVIVLKTYQGEKILAKNRGSLKETTNNRMELIAVIEALKEFRSINDVPDNVTVYTDSQYVQKGISEWIITWKRNNWRTSDKTAVKNKDLWTELDSLTTDLSIKWEWIRGHSGDKYNEMCDEMTRDSG